MARFQKERCVISNLGIYEGTKAKKYTLDESLDDQGKINVHPLDFAFTEKPSQ